MSARVIDKQAYFQKIGYVPHSQGQRDFHSSQSRFKIAVCGRRYGKSTMSARDFEPNLLLPDKLYWIVGNTYDAAEKEFRIIYDDMVRVLGFGKSKQIKRTYNKRSGEMALTFPWGTTLEVRSADHPENLVGEGLDGVLMSEAAKQRKDTWERFIRPALSDKLGFATFVTTPEGTNWVYDLWQHGQNPTYQDYASWRFPSWENRHVFPGGRDDPEIKLLERTVTPEWFLQEIGADFSAFVGKIFKRWDETFNVRTVPFDPALPNYMGIDPGYTNPFAAVEFQIGPNDEVRIWREYYEAYKTTDEHIAALKARDNPPGYHLDLAFCDSADPGTANMVSRGLVACVTDEDSKDWKQGIELMNRLMLPRGNGSCGYMVDYSCVSVIREHNNYRAKEGTRNNDAPDAAKKVDDHTLDAIRYALFNLFLLGAQTHLSDVYVDPALRRSRVPEKANPVLHARKEAPMPDFNAPSPGVFTR